MGIKVIHYKNDFFHFWVHDINKVFYFFCPVNCSPVLPDTDMMLPSKRFYESKDAACTITDIFGIYFPVISRAHWQRFPCLSQQLVWFFIHADDRTHWVIREFIDIENIFHTCYEFCILFWRDAPIVIEVRSKFIFLIPCGLFLCWLVFPIQYVLSLPEAGVSIGSVLRVPDRKQFESNALPSVHLPS